MPAIASTSGRLHSDFIRILFLQTHGETDRFFATSGVHFFSTSGFWIWMKTLFRPLLDHHDRGTSQEHDRGVFHYHRVVFSSQLKSKTDSILTKASSLRFNLNIDGSPIMSKSHTHPSHSQASHLLTSSLSLGAPVPCATQCM